MARQDNPSVARACPMSGPAGEAPGHLHWFDHVARQLAHQCAICLVVVELTYDEISAYHQALAEVFPDPATVAFPPCANCGGRAFYAVNNVVHGRELPHAFTADGIRQLATQEKLDHHVDQHRPEDQYQGRDFSHLPKKQRPPWHEEVTEYDLAGEAFQLLPAQRQWTPPA